MPFGNERFLVYRVMRWHRGGVDQQIERRARKHLVDVRVHIWHFKLLGAFFRTLDDNVAHADNLDKWLRRKVRQVRAGNAATADLTHSDFSTREVARAGIGFGSQQIWGNGKSGAR